ncbi:hypothetical protein M2232_007237 [Bradyrhizobium japonicum]|uniref:hypothetical protein n=1 Tax=Bradyrhizobium japonicum TaxID=375 RepID=UPI0022267827|nr:hypothetical protein [Bradyrhizobium japonicum]MCW2223705.1 hypothetical protein [Bradyrhizobium japonicum]MCW2348317.1 hypothetical protein [Bradyrhizobium japonicum]
MVIALGYCSWLLLLVIALGYRYCRNHAACARAQQAQVRYEAAIGARVFRKAEWSATDNYFSVITVRAKQSRIFRGGTASLARNDGA